jgi:hypothetical protein
MIKIRTMSYYQSSENVERDFKRKFIKMSNDTKVDLQTIRIKRNTVRKLNAIAKAKGIPAYMLLDEIVNDWFKKQGKKISFEKLTKDS